MKTKLTFKLIFLTLFAFNSWAQNNAKPQAIDMTIQIGGSLPSNLGGALAFPSLIPVLAWSEGISTSCTTANTCPTPNQQDISFTVYQTTDFIRFRKALLTNTKFNLELVSAFGNGDVSKIYLEDASVSSISTGGSGGEDRLTMNVSIFAPKWDHNFQPSKASGMSSIHFGWNFVTNTAFSHY